MKQVITSLVVLSILTACGQNSPQKNGNARKPLNLIAVNEVIKGPVWLQNQDESCNKGILAAQEDEQKGIIGYYFWGIAIPPVAHILEVKYGFKIHTKGCVMTEEAKAWSCYNEYMDE
jgi:hypothetical protein